MDKLGQYLREYESQRYTWQERWWMPLMETWRRRRERALVVQPDFIEFPDVSFYQGQIDWEAMRRKIDTVIIRAGQNEWIDTQFERNYAEAKRVGMRRGVYWFYDGRKSPRRQADLLIALLHEREPEMEIVADWEKNYGGAYEGLENVTQFMQYVEAGLPKSRGTALYSGYYWFTGNSSSIVNASQYAWLKQRPLWLAWYANASVVKIPPPWTTWWLWQTGTPPVGNEYGVETVEIDMNTGNGTRTYFDQRYGAVAPPGDAMDSYYRVNVGTLNVRTGPGASHQDIGDLIQGDLLIVSEIVGGWAHLKDARHGSWTGAPVLLADGISVAGRAAITNDVWCNASYLVTTTPPVTERVIAIDVTLDDNDQATAVSVDGVKFIQA